MSNGSRDVVQRLRGYFIRLYQGRATRNGVFHGDYWLLWFDFVTRYLCTFHAYEMVELVFILGWRFCLLTLKSPREFIDALSREVLGTMFKWILNGLNLLQIYIGFNTEMIIVSR